ncbi:alkaline shock response membrane anchor protein AmaP [Nocardiopsis xinjiangensis]|uniref:alkaline shock response membrane anchor protein AmaP n=1 Tax=Nocardiopsis xinjiangensis TaxID=124285 RepID=UPI00034A6B87|nr:alkaline shock response membrane anchor protein AmaP [Nocardiopsis xinjiangensis]
MARDRYRRSARGNRWGLAVVGAVLLVAGLAALAAGQGFFGAGPAGQALLGETAQEVLTQQWVPYVAVAVAFVAAFLALRWLMSQGIHDTVRRLSLEGGGQGRVLVDEGVVSDVVESEVADYPGVRRARAHLTESAHHPHLRLALTLDEDADVAQVWHRVRGNALADLRRSLGLEEVPAVVRMSMTAPTRHTRRSLA